MTSVSSRSRPTKDDVGTGRFVLLSVFSCGNAALPSWNSRTGSSKSFSRWSPRSRTVAPVDETASRLGEEHLPAVAGAHDPRRLVHVLANVLRRIETRLTSVDPGPDPDRRRLEGGHRLLDRSHRLTRRGEGVEEPVPGGVDLVAGVTRARRPDDPTLLVERGEIRVATELAKKPRRALNVSEHQRDRPRRLRNHPHIIRHAQAPAKKPENDHSARAALCERYADGAWRGLEGTVERNPLPRGGRVSSAFPGFTHQALTKPEGAR